MKKFLAIALALGLTLSLGVTAFATAPTYDNAEEFEPKRAVVKCAADGQASVYAADEDDAEDTDVPQVRKAFYRTIMSFVREIMLSEKLPRHQAFKNVEAVEDAYRQSEKAIGDEAVLSLMLDRIVLP